MVMIFSNYYHGIVVDAEVGHPLVGAELNVFDKDNKRLKKLTCDFHGNWRLEVDSAIAYLEFSAEKCSALRINYSTLERVEPNHIRLLPLSPVGFVDRLEAKPGEHLKLRVHATSEWYYTLNRHGLRKVPIINCGPFSPVIQSLPLGSLVPRGIDWAVVTCIDLPEQLESGLYSITITDVNGLYFAMPLAIGSRSEDTDCSTRFLVMANTNTWQAYNVWGGKSRYRNFYNDPINGSIQSISTRRYSWDRVRLALIRRLLRLWRLLTGGSSVSGIRLEPAWIKERLSILRPFPNRWLNADSPETTYLDHLAANEWRGLAWLEREGFKYDYCSDRMLHQGEFNLTDYKGVIFLGHAEYWTKAMFDNLRKAIVDHGLPLINLSGNSIYQEVELDSEGSMVPKHGEFRETYIDPAKTIKTYTALDIGGFAPYQTVSSAKEHWALDGVIYDTKEMIFGKHCLIDTTLAMNEGRYDPLAPGILRGDMQGNGASGWEVDKVKDLNNEKIQWLAKGLNHGGGGHMFVIETTQQFVFSASSIAFVSSLLIDPICSTITRNILLRALKRAY